MTSNELKVKWSKLIDNSITSGFRSLRVSPSCICELFIGVNLENSRCLILSLPQNKHINFKGIQKENLTIEYFHSNKLIVLQLLDSEYNDLFDDLVLSLYHGIKDITNVDEYSHYFIQSFYRWSDFFEEKQSDLISEETLKGLIGELLVLKSLLLEQEGPDVNLILNSWKGPYDKGNDFELETKNIEVKTKTPAGIDVKISSEFQLELPSGKGLELIVISLISDDTLGKCISELIIEIIRLIQQSSGDSSIMWKALRQKSITFKNVSNYDRYRFIPINRISYNCSLENFPKLSRSNIPYEINSLKYNLRVNLLTNYIIEKIDY